MMVRQVGVSLGVVIAVVALVQSVGERAQPSVARAGPSGHVMHWTFDTDAVGKPPRGAVVFSGTWAVRAEPDAPSPPNALCQTGSAEFPAIVLGDAVFQDVVLSTRFKPIAGREDQAAGVIFHVQDHNNYYIVRANALEDNVNIFKYEHGRRRQIKEGAARVPSGRWQTLRVEVRGPSIRGFLDGRLAVEATDATYRTGKIGLWTKADSVTCFDDVEAR